MKHTKWSSFSALLVFAGIVIGIILASGLGLTGNINADNPEKPGIEAKAGDNDSAPEQPTTPSNAALYALSDAFANVAAKVNPAVVTISTETTVHNSQNFRGTPFENFFRGMPEDYTQRGLGSGVIIDSDGVILTNNHVVDKADDIIVRLIDGRELKAEVKGTDPRTDLAVIKIDASGLPFVKLGNSDEVRVGEWVLAIGSPLEENFAHTVTAGIISAKGRTGVGLTQYEDFIQTDAAINPGNSGGALVNLKGELIGINTAIASRSGGNIGIGFAIPSNLASKVKSDIITRGKVVRGWLGVNIRDITPEFAKMYDLKTDEGVLIREVVQDGPAEAAGVQAGDVVVALDGKKIRNVTELSTKVGSTEPDKIVKLEVLRDGKTKEIAVKLGEFPEDENLLAGGSSIRGGAQKVSSLGFEVKDLNDNLRRAYDFSSSDEGVVITSISESSIAARAGLQEGDLIVKINRDFVENLGDFQKVLDTLEPGDAVAFFLKRGDRKLVVDFIVPKV